MFRRFISIFLAVLIGAPLPALSAPAPAQFNRGASIERSVTAPHSSLPLLAQRLNDTIPPPYMLSTADIAPVASWTAATDPFPSAILTHSRTSNATMFDSTGKETFGPNNLVLNSATLSTQTVSVQVGVNYILSIKGTGSVTLTGASTAGPLNGTGASNRVDLKITAATSSLTLTVSGSVTSARLSAVTYETTMRADDDVDTTAAQYFGPRTGHAFNGYSWVRRGLLVEPQITNLAVNSDGLSSWSVGALTKTTNSVASPTGVTNATLLTDDTSTGVHQIYSAPDITAGVAYTASAHVKMGTGRYICLSVYGSTNFDGAYAVVDLQLGAITQTNAFGTGGTIAGYGITPLGDGWYRVYVGTTFTAGDTSAYFTVSGASAGTYTPAGQGHQSYTGTSATRYVFGAQLEANGAPTTYVPTASSAVARAADVVTFVGAALQKTNATYVVEAYGLTYNPTTDSTLVGYDNAISYITNSNAVGTAKAAAYNGSVALITSEAPDYRNLTRIASGFSPAGRAIAVNGGIVAADANTTGAITDIYLGSRAGSSSFLNGFVSYVGVYNTKAPNASITNLSSPSSVSFLVFGDSKTETATITGTTSGGTYTEGTRDNWVPHTFAELGISNWKNYAQSGANFVYSGGLTTFQYLQNQIERAHNDGVKANYIILDCGTNDINNAASTVAFQTAVDAAVASIKAYWPGAVVMFANPQQNAISSPATQAPYLSIISSVASSYGVTVIDQNFLSGVVAANEVFGGSGEWLVDGLHESAMGIRMIGFFMASQIAAHL